MLRPAILFTVTAGVLLTPAEAGAGGWWSFLSVNRPVVAPGVTLEAEDEVFFESVEVAERARTGDRYRAYLIADWDVRILERAMRLADPGEWWTLGDARAFEVASVVVHGGDANLARAHSSFEVPDLAPGSYALMFCTVGCAEPLGDVVPTDVTLVGDPLVAQLATRIDRLDRSLTRIESELRPMKRTSPVDPADLDDLSRRIAALSVRVDSIQPPASDTWLLVGAGLLAGAGSFAGVAGLVRRRRSRRRPSSGVAPWVAAPEPTRVPSRR